MHFYIYPPSPSIHLTFTPAPTRYWQALYYHAGCKIYDFLAGKENMETSYVMSKGKALETFLMLRSNGHSGHSGL
ncbi:hypothetical protein BDQ12DRAFT_613974 [Crucibulum laeve]|uniref:Uncharacterized protein n=1 Tax=Crucibulum laeve TaxID=68775 RepID=A0A5C3LM12_9AGAR|nr:hypothetical protein BDQ12DRAFT_613974 [Crucibulum laeve]